MLYALAGKTSSDLGGPDGLTTAWDQTLADLVTIARPWPLARPIAVIGSSAEDFALAVALDRMLGGTIWFPAEWAHDPALKWPLQIACYDLLNTARSA